MCVCYSGLLYINNIYIYTVALYIDVMLHLEIQDTSPATSATGPAISILKAFA